MAKFRPAGSRKSKDDQSIRKAIPCLVLLVLGIALISVLFYLFLQGSS